MRREKGRGTLRGDLLLIGGLLLLAGLLWLLFAAGTAPGGVAVVRVDGVETERHPLSVDGRFPLNGGTNVLLIEGGSARVVEADCPDRLCVKQGRISRSGQSIVCLPNRLTVTVEGGEDSGVDAAVR